MAGNNTLTCIVAITGILLFIVLIGGFLYFWDKANSATRIETYTVSVRGLTGYQGPIGEVIIVPLPVHAGSQVFSDEELQYKKFGGWTSLLVTTKDGKMLGFQTATANLTDISARFYTSSDDASAIYTCDDKTLQPILPFTVALFTNDKFLSGDFRNYTTRVYLPETIRPVKPDSQGIVFDIEYIFSEGVSFGNVGRNYHTGVHALIPVSISGPIPVNAQVWIT